MIPARGAEALTRVSEPSAHEKLRSEKNMPALAPLVSHYDALAGDDVSIETTRDGEPIIRVAVHQRGTGNRDRVLIFIHGVLSDHRAWRYVAGALGDEYDLWLVDLPGCGDSQKPDPNVLAADGYSPTALADRVLQALQHCVAARSDTPRLMVVAHSLGGMVALRAFSDLSLRQRYDTVFNRIDGIVLLSPADVIVNQEVPSFVQVIHLSGLKSGVASGLGILEQALTELELNASCNPAAVARENVDRFIQVLREGDRRRAGQAMIRHAVPWREDRHSPDWPQMERLEAAYRNVDVPCLIIWGRRDETLPVTMAYKFLVQLPKARVTLLAECKHSPHLCRPLQCAAAIREFERNLKIHGSDEGWHGYELSRVRTLISLVGANAAESQ